MPEGKRCGSATMFPCVSRETCQQSSITTYWYPASFMPDFTIASAMPLIMSSLTLQANLFQLFHPIGGGNARFAEGAAFCAQSGMEIIRPKNASRRFLASDMIQSPGTLKFVLDPKSPAKCAHEEARRFPLKGAPSKLRLGGDFSANSATVLCGLCGLRF